jgi:hypothetical protein
MKMLQNASEVVRSESNSNNNNVNRIRETGPTQGMMIAGIRHYFPSAVINCAELVRLCEVWSLVRSHVLATMFE